MPPSKRRSAYLGNVSERILEVLRADPAAFRAAADLPSRGELSVNAKDYGAIGDGVADDTAALVSARQAAATKGVPLYLPPGTYKHTGLTVTGTIVGSPLSRSVLRGPQITLSTSAVALIDLKIISSSSTALISANCADVKLLRVEVSHEAGVTSHLAWDAYNVDRLRVLDCKFGIGGLQLSLCDDFFINGNHWDCQYANVNEPCHISGQSSGIFSGNTVLNTSTDAVDLYSSGHRCIIANNRFIGLRGGSGLECKVTMSDIPGNSSGPGNVFESTIIANNVFRDFNGDVTSTRTGIYATYIDSRATPAFAVTETNRGIIITGNVLADFNATDPGNGAIVHYQGIVYTGHNGVITNNLIRNMRSWNAATPIGISLASEASDVAANRKCVGVLVEGNHIAGVDSTGGFGIRSGHMDACSISRNVIRGDEITGVQTKFGIAFTAGSNVNQCKISDNVLQCNQANSFGVRAPDTTTTFTECDISGNIFRDCGATIAKAIRTAFCRNTLNNAANAAGLVLGASGVSCLDVRLQDNHFTLGGSSAGVVMTGVDGFIASGNTFKSVTRPLFAFGTTKNGVVTGNISRTQGVGTAVLVFDASVSAPDQGTTYVDANTNKVLT